MIYYDKNGTPLTPDEYVALLTREGQDYRRVAETTLAKAWVSTVWLGINHQYGSGPPLIFETMVFPNADNLTEEYCDRYSTLQEALEGHQKAVNWAEENRRYTITEEELP